MTCKDCLHYEVCYYQEICTKSELEELGKDGGCDFFADRSEWIHLPCSIDTVFFKPISRRNTIAKCTLSSLTQNADKSWKIRLISGIFRSAFEITTNDIGKTVFLTREEAEKALEERK